MGATTRVSTAAQPSPLLFFRTVNAHQQTAALRAAIDLDLFTAIGEGHATPERMARRRSASERGVRILCDYLAVLGFLEKQDDRYKLTLDSATFLDRNSPAYAGSAVGFLNSSMLQDAFKDLTSAVRKGATALPGAGSVEPENPAWVEFARAMAPLMRMPAEWIAGIVAADRSARTRLRVLDIAAGHGLFGISIARRMPHAEITAVDWPNVLDVALENARATGVAARYTAVPGDAFQVGFGDGYDVALLTNFLHHFDRPACVELLKKVRAALNPGGCAVTLEFVPNDDRITPPTAATFALIMLATTEKGDAYTFAQLDGMFRDAGFSSSELMTHPQVEQQAIVSWA